MVTAHESPALASPVDIEIIPLRPSDPESGLERTIFPLEAVPLPPEDREREPPIPPSEKPPERSTAERRKHYEVKGDEVKCM